MEQVSTEEQRLTCQTVRNFVKREVDPLADQMEEEEKVPMSQLKLDALKRRFRPLGVGTAELST